jgi:filamentous hemagglutinin family protein
MINPTRSRGSFFFLLPLAGFSFFYVFDRLGMGNVLAQVPPMMPAPDGTGTIIIPQPMRGPSPHEIRIEGGTRSADGSNLFHSFTHFNLNSGQIANFISNPAIHNILTRVVGGNASLINGLLQVTGGNSNLYIINPAGIIFGPNARLNIPGSFLATTASGIGFQDRWFQSIGKNDYASLIGSPSQFAFPSQPGTIINSGELAVPWGQNLTLLGGVVINTGQLQAPGGNITIAAVPGSHLLRVSQENHLLSLEIAHPSTPATSVSPAPTLPQLLTGGNVEQAMGVTVNPQGEVILTATNQPIPTTPGSAIVSGSVDVSSSTNGGNINLLGSRIGVLNGNLNANGNNNGGQILIGGDARGLGTFPHADRTFVNESSIISANSLISGNAGRVVLWSKEATGLFGRIEARATQQGKGGLVEISSQGSLLFNGTVDVSGSQLGTLLFDPLNINIIDGESTSDDANLKGNAILGSDRPTANFVISKTALENLASNADLVLEATNDITINPLFNHQLSLKTTTGSITFKADSDRNGIGNFSMAPGDRISTQGGAINISGANITLGHLTTQGGNISLNAANTIAIGDLSSGNLTGNSGNINLTAGAKLTTGSLDARGQVGGNIALSANEINLQGGNNSVKSSGTITLQPTNQSQNISLGGNNSAIVNADTLSITSETLAALSPGFSNITIGSPNSSGLISVNSPITFNDPVTIQAPNALGNITLKAPIQGVNNASITLKAAGDIQTKDITTNNQGINIQSTSGNISTGTLQGSTIDIQASKNINTQQLISTSGNVTLRSLNNDITTQDISTTSSSNNSGNIILDSLTNITTGSLNTSGTKAGNISLTTQGNIRVQGINAKGSETGGNITLTGNEIDFLGGLDSVQSNANLILQPAFNRQDINIGGPNLTGAGVMEPVNNSLDLTMRDITALHNGFALITIGHPDGNGAIAISGNNGNITFNNPIIIQSPSGAGKIQAQTNITGAGNASISLIGGEIKVQDITANKGITLTTTQGNLTAGNILIMPQQGITDNININSQGGVQLNNINTVAKKNSGNLIINSRDDLRIGAINLSSQNGNGGSAQLNSNGNIQVSSINTTGGQVGGNIDIQTGGSLRVTDTFRDRNQIEASLSSASGIVDTRGRITIYQNASPFQIGNAEKNGSAGGITDGQITISANRSFDSSIDFQALASQDSGNRNISLSTSKNIAVTTTPKTVTNDAPQNQSNEQILVTEPSTNSNQKNASSVADSTQNPAILNTNNKNTVSTTTDKNAINSTTNNKITTTNDKSGVSPVNAQTNTPNSSVLSQVSDSLPNTNTQNNSNINANANIGTSQNNGVLQQPSNSSSTNATTSNGVSSPLSTSVLSGSYTAPEISRSNYLNPLSGNVSDVLLQIDQSRSREFKGYLGNLGEQRITEQNLLETLSSVYKLTGVKPGIVYVSLTQNQLELRLFLPDGKPIFKSVPVSKYTVLQTALDFTNAVRNPKKLQESEYLGLGQQLYQWLISPLEAELTSRNIQTLIFSMDTGLRTLPIAALHDGKQFLVEKYSFSLIPSLSLTDTRYFDLRNSQVLAMGVSEFPPDSDQPPLPAVPLELSTVNSIWPGISLLNNQFTIENLRARRAQGKYPIIHLATHGEFQPGGANNSYIQFWDRKLHLDELRELKFNESPVELLVLSACSTAVGDDDAELGFAGLAVQAGVKSALASLWYVSDAGTLGLMTEFYQQLRRVPTKAEALRQAQLAMLRGDVRLQDGYLYNSRNREPLPMSLANRGNRSLSHPYFWAAFTLIGSPW